MPLVGDSIDPQDRGNHLNGGEFAQAFDIRHRFAGHIAVNGKTRSGPRHLVERLGEFLRGRIHQRAVEGSADRKGNRPAFLFLNERKGRFHRRLGPADDELGRGVVVGHNEDFSRGFRSGLGDFVHGFAVELEDCRHAALAVGIGVRHQLPAQAYQFKGRFGGQGSGSGQSAVFAKAVAGGAGGGQFLSLIHI